MKIQVINIIMKNDMRVKCSIYPFILILIAFGLSPKRTYSYPQVRAELLTDLPLQLGVGSLLEFDQQWRIASSIGLMPKSYVTLSNQVVMLIPNTYTDPTAELIEDTIQNSMVYRIMGGWSPQLSGFYVHTGYSLATLGGGASTVALIEGITGEEIDRSEMSTMRKLVQIEAAATLHMFSLELGWEWSIKEIQVDRWLTLRAALGWSYTFTSSATLTADTADRGFRVQNAFDRLEAAGESYLVDTFDTYVHPPTLSLALGYQWN